MNGPAASPAPSDRLRSVYEQRAELECPEPIAGATRNRKLEFVGGAVRAALPCEASLDRAVAPHLRGDILLAVCRR